MFITLMKSSPSISVCFECVVFRGKGADWGVEHDNDIHSPGSSPLAERTSPTEKGRGSRDQPDERPEETDMSNNNTVTVDQYDALKAKFLTVDRSYESLKALARKGE